MTTPRTLFIDHTGALGGAELYLLDAARALRSPCHVLLFDDGPFRERLEKENIPVSVCQASAPVLKVSREAGLVSVVRAVPGLINLLINTLRKARSFDVIYINSQKALPIGGLAGQLTGTPVIWNLHDILTADHFSAVNRQLAVWSANLLADRIVVNSEATRRAFADSGGHAEKTTVIYNGIDPTPFESITDDEIQTTRRSLGIDDAPTVGIFSRLAPWKGQHVLLRALADLPEVHALLVGAPLFGEEEKYAQKLHSLTERLGLSERVHFLGFRDDVPTLMAAVDVVVHASTAPEPFGRVIVEGMMAGTPVIATRAGGAQEIIDHEQTGLLIPPDTPDALCNAIQRLIKAPDYAHKLACTGREAALTHFTVESMVHRIQEEIEAATYS